MQLICSPMLLLLLSQSSPCGRLLGKRNPRHSYGFSRIEILGALVSVQLIWLLAGVLVYEAITRLFQQTNDDVDGFFMVLVAAFGLVVNIIMVVVLGHDHDNGHYHIHGHGHVHDHEHD